MRIQVVDGNIHIISAAVGRKVQTLTIQEHGIPFRIHQAEAALVGYVEVEGRLGCVADRHVEWLQSLALELDALDIRLWDGHVDFPNSAVSHQRSASFIAFRVFGKVVASFLC